MLGVAIKIVGIWFSLVLVGLVGWLVVFSVLGIESGAFCMPGKGSTMELHPPAPKIIFK